MALTVVGGAFLSASLQVLFDRLASREVVNLFSRRTSNVNGLLKKLKRKLLLLDVVIEDADVKQFTNKLVRAWSDEARDAVYQADDLVNEIAYVARRREVESDPVYQSSQVHNSSSNSFTSFDDHIEPKLKKIIKLLKDVIKESSFLGLKEGVRGVPISKNRSPSESSSLVIESDVYGRESEKEELINLLLSDETSGPNNEVGVIPVVGMGGLGKTTLARLAYDDFRVTKHFEKTKAWVCVSQEFNVLRVSKAILESVTHCTSSSTDLNEIQESLLEKLKGIKFLLVLDDIWNENYSKWDSFRTPFRTGAPGSKIIVTTHIQDAASIMKTGRVINLTKLSENDCWSLFSKIAFDQRDPSSYLLLEGIGRKIVKRCKGLPLAAKSLAGLLRSKIPEEWDDVLRSEFWDLPEDKSDILPALRLSYHYLPSHLKQCFAFCSLFPKNYEFDEEEVAPMWIAHKYVQPQGGRTYEMEGRKCFRELLSMSFFQKSAHDGSFFVMHDLIHDLAELVSGQFFVRIDHEREKEISIKARHLLFYPSRINGFQLLAAKEVNSLRTFMPIRGCQTWGSKTRWDELLSRQQHMQVLSLRYYSRANELYNLIGSLVHLHYLDLSYTEILQLPESVCRLHNLQTLLLFNCKHLTTLPVEIGKLFSLHRLDVRGTNLIEMPMQMSKLSGLEYLTKFVLGKSGGLGIEWLKAMSSLRGTLTISGLENVRASKDAFEAKLKDMEQLQKLDLEWGWCGVTDIDSRYEREVLDCLRPHTNLKELSLTRYRGTRFSDWLGNDLFSQLASLRLEECTNCYELPPLGQLPSLKELIIRRICCVVEVGEEFYGSCAGGTGQPFPSLESLTFEGMSEWVEWSLPGLGEFPKLRKFRMKDCPKLVGGLPECSDFIDIKDCSSLKASVPTLRSSSSSSSSSPIGANQYFNLTGSEEVEVNWQNIMYLRVLSISDLPSLKVLTPALFLLTRLRILSVCKCPNLVSLSKTGLPPMLVSLHIEECELLRSVVDGIVSFTDNGGLPSSLTTFRIIACPKLELPVSEDTKSCCSSVEYLELYGSLAQNLATLLNLFPNIRSLVTGPDDTNIARFLEHRELSKLTRFVICGGKKLVRHSRSGWGLRRLPSLKALEIIDDDESVESFPDEGLLPSTLTSLAIAGFPNLKTLNWRSLQKLTSLQSLYIGQCPKLESLPDEELPPSIQKLLVHGCPLLESHFPGLKFGRHYLSHRLYQRLDLPDQ